MFARRGRRARRRARRPIRAPARPDSADETSRGFVADYAAVLSNPWARLSSVAVFLEGALFWGAFAYVGADLHLRFGLSFTAVGLIVGTSAIGGLIYAATVQPLVDVLGQTGLAIGGGVLLGLAYLMLASAPAWWLAPIAVTSIGLGFYMLHNTLQTNATQMTPEARGTAVAVFSSAHLSRADCWACARRTGDRPVRRACRCSW